MWIILLFLQLILIFGCQTNGESGVVLAPNKNISEQDENLARTKPRLSSASSNVTSINSTVSQFEFNLHFSKEMFVNGCIPTAKINIGGTNYTAVYQTGHTTSIHTYQVTLNTNTVDTDGPTITAPIYFTPGCLVDSTNRELTSEFSPKTISNLLVDQIEPTVTSFSLTPATGPIAEGSTVTIKANLSEVSNLNTTAGLTFTLNGNPRTATYVSGNNTSQFTFTYNVTGWDVGVGEFVFGNLPTDLKDIVNNSGSAIITPTVRTIQIDAYIAPMFTQNMVPVSFNEDTITTVTLDYTNAEDDPAIACSLTNLNQVIITQACSCSAGVCTVGVRGSTNYNGAASFSFMVQDTAGNWSNTSTATLTILAVNDSPIISDVSNLSINEDSSSSAISFSISDADNILTCSSSVTKSSSNNSLLAASGIVISGTAPNCFVTLTPLADTSGTSTITLTVSDGSLNAFTTFALSITAIDDAPSVSPVGPISFNVNTESILNLNYSDSEGHFATSCSISNLSNISLSTGCSCDLLGVCTVGVTGDLDYVGSAAFDFTVTANSLVSNSGAATLSIDQTPPPAPVGFTASTSSSSVNLNWIPTPRANSYTVYFSLVDGGPYSAIDGCTNQIAVSCNHISLLNGTPYYYVVKSHNTAGFSLHSSQVSATPSSITEVNWDFVSGSYLLNPSIGNNAIELNGGEARLKSPDQIDGDDAGGDFLSASSSVGVLWDGNQVQLANEGVCNGTISDCAPGSPDLYSMGLNPTAYYKFDNSWDDVTAGTLDAVPTGATFTTSTRITGNHSGNFASGNYVTIPNGYSNTIKADDSHTISIWFYPENGASIMTLLNAPSTGYRLQIKSRSTAPANLTDAFDEILWTVGALTRIYGLRASAPLPSKGYVKIRRNKWNHIAIVKTGGAVHISTNVYLNGSLLTYNNDTVDPWIAFTSTPNVISDFEIGRNGAGEYFIGKIDELAIWNTILSPNDIDKIYGRQARSAKSGVLVSRVMDASTDQLWDTLKWSSTFPFGKPLSYQVDELTADYPDLSGTDFKTGLLTHIPFDGTLGTVSQGDTFPAYGAHTTPVTVVTKTADSTLSIGEGKIGRGLFFGTATSGSVAANVNKPLIGAGLQNLTASLWFKLGERAAADASTIESSRVLMQWMTPASPASRPFHIAVNTRKGNLAFNISGGTFTTNLVGSTTFQPETEVWNNIILTAEKTALTTTAWKCYYNGVLTGAVSITAISGGTDVFGDHGSSTQTLSIGSGNNILAGTTGTYRGNIDEVAIWSRTMSAAEAKKLYRRGASKLKFQVKSCDDADCGDSDWKGPDGTASTYFSEFHNKATQGLNPSGDVLATPPSIDLTKFNLGAAFPAPGGLVNKRYFQYRTILESDSADENDLPKLSKVEIGPTRYTNTSPSIVGLLPIESATVTGLGPVQGVSAIYSLLEDSSTCPGGVTYNIGIGPDHTTSTWYWWNSSEVPAEWEIIAIEDPSKSNSTDDVFSHQTSLPIGASDKIYFKAFLNSNGTNPCILHNVLLRAIPN